MSTKAAFYQSVGEELTHYDVDVEAATLTRRGSITLPSKVQYVWRHPTKPFMVVSTSDAASGNTPNPGVMHRLCAVRIDESGELSLHGEPQALPNRPHPSLLEPHGHTCADCI